MSAGPGALHVERYGNSGDAVLLLHGFGTTSFLWRALAPSLAAAGYTAYAMDMLGYGESDRPLEADYSIAAQAQYVERALTSLRVQRAAVVGVDIGGGVAQRLAVTKKNGVQVSHLALINSVGLDQCPGREVRNVQRDTARFAFHVARGVLGAAPLLRRLLAASVADQKHMPEGLLARYMAPFAGSDGVSHLLVLARALHAEDVEDLRLATIAASTLIIWGETDAWLDSGLAERLQGAIPQSRVIRLPGVGRLVPEEAPDSLSELLLEFLRS